MIEITGLSKRYALPHGSVTALRDVSLRLEEGERFGLLGQSGCGKTTLLRCICGLVDPDQGSIIIAGTTVLDRGRGINLPPWQRPIGLVFQEHALWPHLRVLDNVLFPLRHGRGARLARAEQLEQAREALRLAQLQGCEQRFPAELSGGQRQRVAVARALASRPQVLLLDEPLSSLDPQLRIQTRNELTDILERAGTTTIVVSHDHADGLLMTHRIGVMHQGELLQQGIAPAVFADPLDAAVARTLDLGAVVPCRVRQAEAPAGVEIELASSGQRAWIPRGTPVQPGEECQLLIRAGACREDGNEPGAWRQALRGIVARTGFNGRAWTLCVDIGGAQVEATAASPPTCRPGDAITISVDLAQARLFPVATAAPAHHS